MALPTSYLTSTKNLAGILNSIVGAQAPDKFTVRFLESLGFKGNADRLIIGVLKSLEFLGDDGRPTQRYFEYLDQTRSEVVLADAIRDTYADLFQVNKNANAMSRAEVLNKFKTLTQGQYSEAVLGKMASTFVALCGLADFKSKALQGSPMPIVDAGEPETPTLPSEEPLPHDSRLRIGGLVYNIELVLPESRDPKVYEALFQALRRHLS